MWPIFIGSPVGAGVAGVASLVAVEAGCEGCCVVSGWVVCVLAGDVVSDLVDAPLQAMSEITIVKVINTAKTFLMLFSPFLIIIFF
jgi:hypothetical protein